MATIIEAIDTLTNIPDGPARITAAIEELGGRAALAVNLAGTSDKRSKEYKAALKSVERWDRYAAGERGPNVRRPNKEVLDKIGRTLRERRIPRGGLLVRVRGTVTVSEDARSRDFSVRLSRPEAMGLLGVAEQAALAGEDPATLAMNVITGAYLGGDLGDRNVDLPYSERMSYGGDIDVTVRGLR